MSNRGVVIRVIICLIMLPLSTLANANTVGIVSATSSNSVDINASSLTAQSVPTALEVKSIKNINDELHIVLRNNHTKSHSVSLKILGLNADNYGLYSNGKYLGKYDKQKLEEGLSVELPQSDIPAWQLDYIRCVRDNASQISPLFKSRIPNDAAVAWDSLVDVSRYTNSIVIAAEAWRSTRLILTPNDAAVKMSPAFKQQDVATQRKLVDNNMLYINWVRRTISTNTSQGEIHNLAMSAITPVKIKYEIPKNYTPGSKFTSKVTIQNTTNVPINAMPIFAGAPGWIFKPKKAASVTNLGAQQTAVLEYWGAAPKDPAQAAVRPNPSTQIRISDTDFKFTLLPLPEPEKNTTPSTTPN